jgi:hypothetical protein
VEGSGHGLTEDTILELEGLRKTNLSQDSQSAGQDLNQGPPEYEAGVLTTRPCHLVVLTYAQLIKQTCQTFLYATEREVKRNRMINTEICKMVLMN